MLLLRLCISRKGRATKKCLDECFPAAKISLLAALAVGVLIMLTLCLAVRPRIDPKTSPPGAGGGPRDWSADADHSRPEGQFLVGMGLIRAGLLKMVDRFHLSRVPVVGRISSRQQATKSTEAWPRPNSIRRMLDQKIGGRATSSSGGAEALSHHMAARNSVQPNPVHRSRPSGGRRRGEAEQRLQPIRSVRASKLPRSGVRFGQGSRPSPQFVVMVVEPTREAIELVTLRGDKLFL